MTGVNKVDWDVVLAGTVDTDNFVDFVTRDLSGRELYANYTHIPNKGGQVRNLLRNNGVDKARQLARKALKRRGVCW